MFGNDERRDRRRDRRRHDRRRHVHQQRADPLREPNLPFGGVGASGQGNYHGFYGFKAFSHERAVLRQGRLDLLKQVYPPYTPKVQRMLKWMTKLFT